MSCKELIDRLESEVLETFDKDFIERYFRAEDIESLRTEAIDRTNKFTNVKQVENERHEKKLKSECEIIDRKTNKHCICAFTS